MANKASYQLRGVRQGGATGVVLTILLAALILTATATAAAPAPIPDNIAAARAHFLEARAADRRGAAGAALAAYGQAFRHDPRSRDLCFLYLERLKDAGAVDSARAVAAHCVALAAERALPSSPSEPLTALEHKLLGEVALRAEDAPAALHHYEAALRLGDESGSPGGTGDDLDVLYVLAGLYENGGDWERHAEAVRRLLPQLGYPPRLMERLGRIYVRLDRVPDFIPVLEEAWERTRAPLFGQTLAAHYEANGLNLSLLRIARALALAEPGLESDALLARAWLLADRPDSALALTGNLLARAAAAARASQPREPREAPAPPGGPPAGVLNEQGLRFLYATLLFERGRYQEARPHALALVQAAPREPAHHLLAGSILLELEGSPQEIRAALDHAVALAPFTPEYRARRAYAEYALAAADTAASLPHDSALGRIVDSLLTMPVEFGGEWSPAEGMGGADGTDRTDGTGNDWGGGGVPVPVITGGTRDGGASRPATDAIAEERRLLREGFAQGRLAQELAPREPGQRPSVLAAVLGAAQTAQTAQTVAQTATLLSRHHRLRALERYEAILAKNSGHRAALFEAGVQYERLGHPERAKPLFRRLLARDTLHATAMNYLAYTLLEQDTVTPPEMEEAAVLLKRALALEPENGAYRDSWGWWHYRQGAYDSALTWLEAADEAVPGDATILEHLVLTQYALGRRADACATLRRLQALNPRHGFTMHCPAGEAP